MQQLGTVAQDRLFDVIFLSQVIENWAVRILLSRPFFHDRSSVSQPGFGGDSNNLLMLLSRPGAIRSADELRHAFRKQDLQKAVLVVAWLEVSSLSNSAFVFQLN